jgi:hypothetical protein
MAGPATSLFQNGKYLFSEDNLLSVQGYRAYGTHDHKLPTPHPKGHDTLCYTFGKVDTSLRSNQCR